jgi:hypothetical protein
LLRKDERIRDHLLSLGVGGRIILKTILNKDSMEVRPYS